MKIEFNNFDDSKYSQAHQTKNKNKKMWKVQCNVTQMHTFRRKGEKWLLATF